MTSVCCIVNDIYLAKTKPCRWWWNDQATNAWIPMLPTPVAPLMCLVVHATVVRYLQAQLSFNPLVAVSVIPLRPFSWRRGIWTGDDDDDDDADSSSPFWRVDDARVTRQRHWSVGSHQRNIQTSLFISLLSLLHHHRWGPLKRTFLYIISRASSFTKCLACYNSNSSTSQK